MDWLTLPIWKFYVSLSSHCPLAFSGFLWPKCSTALFIFFFSPVGDSYSLAQYLGLSHFILSFPVSLPYQGLPRPSITSPVVHPTLQAFQKRENRMNTFFCHFKILIYLFLRALLSTHKFSNCLAILSTIFKKYRIYKKEKFKNKLNKMKSSLEPKPAYLSSRRHHNICAGIVNRNSPCFMRWHFSMSF